MTKFAVWQESGKTSHVWAESEADAWLKSPHAKHVGRVRSSEADLLRSSAQLAEELAQAETCGQPMLSG